jgi:hypothetical protein
MQNFQSDANKAFYGFVQFNLIDITKVFVK